MNGDTVGKSLQAGIDSSYAATMAAIEALKDSIRSLDPARGDELIAQAQDLVRLGYCTTSESLERAAERARMGT